MGTFIQKNKFMKYIRKYNNINESKDENVLIQSIEDTFSDIKKSYGLKVFKGSNKF